MGLTGRCRPEDPGVCTLAHQCACESICVYVCVCVPYVTVNVYVNASTCMYMTTHGNTCLISSFLKTSRKQPANSNAVANRSGVGDHPGEPLFHGGRSSALKDAYLNHRLQGLLLCGFPGGILPFLCIMFCILCLHSG